MRASDDQKAIHPQRHIQLEVVAGSFPVFLGMLRSGFAADITLGCSLQHILCDQMQISADYLQNRVQTVFLNHSPVDDLSNTAVSDGAVISLSAAMPGLNGAVMRRGGPLAGLRRSISHSSDGICNKPSPGRITLKLFNMIAQELAPHFLSRGIIVGSNVLNELIARQTRHFRQGVLSVVMDRSPCQVGQLIDQKWPEQELILVVRAQ